MKKKLTYRHLDNDSTMEVILHLYEEEGHWVAKIESSADAVKTPTFYGTTIDQAERQMRKVLERDHELVAEKVIEA